jgi:hypothetical protein
MGPRASLDDMEKGKFLTRPGLELRPVGRPVIPTMLSQLLNNFSMYCSFLQIVLEIRDVTDRKTEVVILSVYGCHTFAYDAEYLFHENIFIKS